MRHYTPWGIVSPKRPGVRAVADDRSKQMCRAVKCRECGKTTWAGCGQHKNEVLRGVPKNQRCSCTPAEKAAAKGGFFSRLFGG